MKSTLVTAILVIVSAGASLPAAAGDFVFRNTSDTITMSCKQNGVETTIPPGGRINFTAGYAAKVICKAIPAYPGDDMVYWARARLLTSNPPGALVLAESRLITNGSTYLPPADSEAVWLPICPQTKECPLVFTDPTAQPLL